MILNAYFKNLCLCTEINKTTMNHKRQLKEQENVAVSLRSLITETRKRTNTVPRLRSQNGLGQKWFLLCQQSHAWFSFSRDSMPYLLTVICVERLKYDIKRFKWRRSQGTERPWCWLRHLQRLYLMFYHGKLSAYTKAERRV